MKRTGILMTLGGALIFAASFYDLFGKKQLPVGLTVTTMLLALGCAFSGPAVTCFTLPAGLRERIARYVLVISLLVTAAGMLSGYLHWPGAAAELTIGMLALCFFYGLLSLRNKYEKWKVYTRSNRDAFFLSSFDFVGIAALALGILFRLQHWPLSKMLTTIGCIVLAIGIFAWNQKFKKEVVHRKETEDKLKVSLEAIEKQHLELEEKQKEILDSIRYAKRIQSSHLPTEKYIEQCMKRMRK